MKTIFVSFLLLLSFPSWAARHDIADFCGPVEYSGGTATVTDGGKVYQLISTEYMTVELMKRYVPHGARMCVRGWQDMDDPRTVLLFEFFPER